MPRYIRGNSMLCLDPLNHESKFREGTNKYPFISSFIKAPRFQKQILIIEDNLINQRVAFTYLTELGQKRIDIARNGYKALALIERNYYSLIFLDIDLPDISGFELCETIKNSYLNSNTTIVVATSHHEKKIIKKCLALGADAVIAKPLNFDLLKENLPLWLALNNKINHIRSIFKSKFINKGIYEKKSS